MYLFFLQAEDGIRDLVRSRGLGDVYKRQGQFVRPRRPPARRGPPRRESMERMNELGFYTCLLYTSDAVDERSRVDLGGRRIIKKHTHFP